MITPAHSELAYSLTKHYFGESVASVLKTLFNYDQASLRVLKFALPATKLADLKKSLLILVKYQLVDFVKTVKNFNQLYEYSVVPHRVFSFFTLSTFVYILSENEGPIIKSILSVITEKAILNKDDISRIVLSSKMTSSPNDKELTSKVFDSLERLISSRYLAENNGTVCINIERFNRNYRDHLILDTVHRYYNRDDNIKSLCSKLLEISIENTHEDAATTAPVPLMELVSSLVPKIFVERSHLERCLSKMTSESNNRFFLANGNHPNKGPMYSINVGLVIDFLVKEHLSSLITSRFGPRCCRVFKVLLLKGPLLLKQIEEIIMLPARDVREYCYMLIKEGFIRNRQVPKTPDNAPGKSVFIMSVELDQVVYSVTDICCRSINNLLNRLESELHRNKSLLDRSKAVQDLLKNSAFDCNSNSSQDDWNQYFNSHEQKQLDCIDRISDKVLLAKTQVDETLFLLHTWSHLRPDLNKELS